MSQKKSSLISKLLSVVLTTLIQAISLIGFYMLYSSIFKADYSINMGITFYYYQLLIFPLCMVTSNVVTMFSRHRYYVLISFVVISGVIFFFLGKGLLSNPYRIGSLLFASFVLYAIGVIVISRLRDWLS